MRSVFFKNLAAAGVFAFVGIPAVSYAEYRQPHPEPVESLIYGSQSGNSASGSAMKSRESDREAMQKSRAETPAAKSGSKTSGTKTGATVKSDAKTNPKAAPAKASTKARATAVSDTSRPIGTPGSPTTKGVKGTGVKTKK